MALQEVINFSSLLVWRKNSRQLSTDSPVILILYSRSSGRGFSTIIFRDRDQVYSTRRTFSPPSNAAVCLMSRSTVCGTVVSTWARSYEKSGQAPVSRCITGSLADMREYASLFQRAGISSMGGNIIFSQNRPLVPRFLQCPCFLRPHNTFATQVAFVLQRLSAPHRGTHRCISSTLPPLFKVHFARPV